MLMLVEIALCSVTDEDIKGTDQGSVVQSFLSGSTTLGKLDHFFHKYWIGFLGVP